MGSPTRYSQSIFHMRYKIPMMRKTDPQILIIHQKHKNIRIFVENQVTCKNIQRAYHILIISIA